MGNPSPLTPSHVAVYCLDAPGSAAGRKAAAQAHLRYIETILDRLLMAGPLFAEDGSAIVGSLYVFNTSSLSEAKRLLEADPYCQAGFWHSVDCRPLRPAAGDCVNGGKIW